MPQRSWHLLPIAPPEHFKALGNLPPLVAQVLYHRGIRSLEQHQRLARSGDQPLLDPLLMPGMDRAAERIRKAIAGGETIGIVGDFDADGITASAVLYQSLTDLGGRVATYIPHRVEEGHGLSATGVERLTAAGASLILTADCGITSVKEVAQAGEAGVDVLIVDHHTPPPLLPTAYTILNPRLPDSTYPFTGLASVGVAFKLAQALYQASGKPWDRSLLELVALGTVADQAPLTEENHALVKQGIAALNRTHRPGLLALMETARLERGKVDAEAIGFLLGPRLNAAGRLDHAGPSFELLTTPVAEEAQRLAQTLESRNVERQDLCEALLRDALPKAEKQKDEQVLIIGGPDYHPGVVGLVASKLVERYYRPAVVMQEGASHSRASARSIPEFNIIQAFTECRDLFSVFGGHPQAAGFSIPSSRLPELTRRLRALASSRLAGKDLQPFIAIDAEVPLTRLTGATLPHLMALAPFGQGNAPPTFLSRRVQVLEQRGVGSDNQHALFKLKAGPAVWEAIAFRQGRVLSQVNGSADIVYTFSLGRWGGDSALKLNILDLEPA
ncbi:MAG: single-stranded-DNA-specific exonuclease RecJ [Chloroflexi bacterium]|nr:single-stranded-DNA-specific exonuclease RecJ [Chloroflexota bacterium]